jgi:DNA-binding NarL/FixJ family response regulator
MEALKRIGLVADDDAYFRIAVSAILARQFGFAEVREASSLDEAVEILGEGLSISAALFDLSMPGMKTPANLRAVRECFPSTRVAVISASNSRRDILQALEAGVHGYMLKSLSIADLKTALQTVFSGGIYVPPSLAEISSIVAEAVRESVEPLAPDQVDPGHALTSRQNDVLDLLVKGKSNKEIALALKIGEGTVKIHMAAIFRHFGVNNRAAAAVAGAQPHPSRPRVLASSRS